MCLDERVEPERLRVAHQRGAARVVEVAQQQQHRVGPGLRGGPEIVRASRRSPWPAAGSRSSPAGGAQVVPGARRSARRRAPTSPARRRARRRAPPRATSPSGRRSPADGERRLNSAIAPKPGGESVSTNLMRSPVRTRSARSRRSPAAPESIAMRAIRVPRRDRRAWPPAAIAPAAFRSTAERWAPGELAAAKTSRRSARSSPGRRRAARSGRSGPRRGRAGRARTRARRRSRPRDEVRPGRRELVDPAGAVDDVGAARAERDERVARSCATSPGDVDARAPARGRPAGFVSGPRTLKTVRAFSSRRTGAACFIAG